MPPLIFLRLVEQRFCGFPGVAPRFRFAAIHPDALGNFSALSRLLRLKDRKGIAIHVGRQGGGAHGDLQ